MCFKESSQDQERVNTKNVEKCSTWLVKHRFIVIPVKHPLPYEKLKTLVLSQNAIHPAPDLVGHQVHLSCVPIGFS